MESSPIGLWIGWGIMAGAAMIGVFVIFLSHAWRTEAAAEARADARIQAYKDQQRHDELVRSGYQDNRTYHIQNQQNNNVGRPSYEGLSQNHIEALGPIDALLKSQQQPLSRNPWTEDSVRLFKDRG